MLVGYELDGITITVGGFAPCPKGVEILFSPRKGVMRMNITWPELFQFGLLVVSIVSVTITAMNIKKK